MIEPTSYCLRMTQHVRAVLVTQEIYDAFLQEAVKIAVAYLKATDSTAYSGCRSLIQVHLPCFPKANLRVGLVTQRLLLVNPQGAQELVEVGDYIVEYPGGYATQNEVTFNHTYMPVEGENHD